MGFGRRKSCRVSSSLNREDSDVVQPPSNGSCGRRRRSMSLLCSLHSSCLASSSISHESDDDNNDDEQVCNGWMRKSHGSVSRCRVESRNQRDAVDCYGKELKDEKKSENERHCDELELDDECGGEDDNGGLVVVGSWLVLIMI